MGHGEYPPPRRPRCVSSKGHSPRESGSWKSGAWRTCHAGSGKDSEAGRGWGTAGTPARGGGTTCDGDPGWWRGQAGSTQEGPGSGPHRLSFQLFHSLGLLCVVSHPPLHGLHTPTFPGAPRGDRPPHPPAGLSFPTPRTERVMLGNPPNACANPEVGGGLPCTQADAGKQTSCWRWGLGSPSYMGPRQRVLDTVTDVSLGAQQEDGHQGALGFQQPRKQGRQTRMWGKSLVSSRPCLCFELVFGPDPLGGRRGHIPRAVSKGACGRSREMGSWLWVS